MKEVYWGYWLIILGVFITIVMMMISNVTTSSTQDYYLIKEVTEAAMLDAVDLAYYRENGELKINREKFVESFLRRFSENVSITNTYTVDFYGIYEAPPKVSVKVSSTSSTFTIAGDSQSFNIIDKVDSILELSRDEAITAPETTKSAATSNTSSDESPISNSNSNNTSSDFNNLTKEQQHIIAPYAAFTNAWYQQKYAECSHRSDGFCKGKWTYKKKYLDDKELYKRELLADYQQHYGLHFTEEEAQQFINSYVDKFVQWAK